MKHIKLFENFINEAINYDKILLDSYGIKNYTINDNGFIDVDGDVELLYEYNLSDIVKRNGGKIPFKFGRVTGNFSILGADLKSLEGCPYYVGGSFRCNDNKLKNLKGSPTEVGGIFFCDHNELESLEGMPLEIGGSFVCWSNEKLKEFDSISSIGGIIMCDVSVDITKFRGYCEGFKILSGNKWIDKPLNESKLTDMNILLNYYSIGNYNINDDGTIDVDGDVILIDRHLVEMPFKFGKVTGDFNCSGNSLESLKGSPYEVGGDFNCSDNYLINLEGSPDEVGGTFDCSYNALKSLDGLTLEISEDLIIYGNLDLKTIDSLSNIGGYIYSEDDVDRSKFDGYCKGFYKLVNFDLVKVDESIKNDYDVECLLQRFEKYVSGYEKSRIIKKLKNFHIIEDTFSDNYTINDDGTIDVDGDVYLLRKNITKLPFRFGRVTGNFEIDHNNLETLEGSPYYVGGKFSCNVNKLKNLIGSPGEVGGDFECSNNSLSSLEGMTPEIGGDFICYDNPELTEFDSISNIEGNIYCNRSVRFSKFKGHTNSIEY